MRLLLLIQRITYLLRVALALLSSSLLLESLGVYTGILWCRHHASCQGHKGDSNPVRSLVGISLNTKRPARCVLTEMPHSSRGATHVETEPPEWGAVCCLHGPIWWPWSRGMRTWGGAGVRDEQQSLPPPQGGERGCLSLKLRRLWLPLLLSWDPESNKRHTNFISASISASATR